MTKVSTEQLLLIYQPIVKHWFIAITGQKYEPASNEAMCSKVTELCIVKWLVSTNEYQWYISYIKQEINKYLVIVNDLHSVPLLWWHLFNFLALIPISLWTVLC